MRKNGIWWMAGQMSILVLAAMGTLGTECPQGGAVILADAVEENMEFPTESELAGDPTQLEFKEAIAALLDAVQSGIPGAKAATALTLSSSGYITPTQSFHTVDTEGGAASDDLNYIVQTNTPDGFFLFLQQADDGRRVTLKHGSLIPGGLVLPGGADITLEDSFDGVILRRAGAYWRWVARMKQTQVTPHGKEIFYTPGSFTWTVPTGVTQIWVHAVGGGGGGGGASDGTSDGADGSAGGTTTVAISGGGTIVSSAGGVGGGKGNASGATPTAYHMAQLPVSSGVGSQAVYVNDPRLTVGQAGTAGNGGMSATLTYCGASGTMGAVKMFYEADVSAGQVIDITVGAGGAGGAPGGSSGGGSNGYDGAVIIEY